ncbi:MAG: hypothetical protein IPP68_06445 [Elusimicrobia bacterium]|nr:hypothetical protein [Elusimicrobiota bacterium]
MVKKRPQNDIKTRGQSAWIMLVFLLLVTAFPLLLKIRTESQKQSYKSEVYDQMAGNFAQGAVELAHAWFRKQGPERVASMDDPVAYPYPDAAFYPRVSSATAACCTLDESIGLVEEQLVDSVKNLWVRLEARRQSTDPSSSTRDPLAVHDITALRYPGHANGEGKAWEITGIATIFVRLSTAVPYDCYPNRKVSNAKAYGEIRFLNLQLPAPAAIWSNDISRVTGKGVVRGVSGIGIAGSTGSLAMASDRVSGTPPTMIVNATVTVESVLGVSAAEFKELAWSRNVMGAEFSTTSGYREGVSDLCNNKAVYTTCKFGLGGSAGTQGRDSMSVVELVESDSDLNIGGMMSMVDTLQSGLFIWNSSKTLTLSQYFSLTGAVVLTGGGSLVVDEATNTLSVSYDPDRVQDIFEKACGYLLLPTSERRIYNDSN